MSVHAGTVLIVGGNGFVDRVQRSGLGDGNVPKEVVREVGNNRVVGKVIGDPDFTWTAESLDVGSTELEAFLTGKWATTLGVNGPGNGDAGGTEYKFSDGKFVNIPSPWKDPATGDTGTVIGGHLLPGYYPTRLRYRFGVSENAVQEVELSGGSYYYNGNTPVEQRAVANGVLVAFATSTAAVPYRRGGATGTSFRSVFGVMVDGVLQTEGVDYTQSPTNSATPAVATVTFAVAPANGADIRFCYFTTAARAYPNTVHPDTTVKPAAVRGRHICVYLGSGGARQKVGSVQSAEIEARCDATVDREFCNEEIVGITINGRDCSGNFVQRSKDADAFLATAAKVTGVDQDEVIGWLNENQIPLEIVVSDPRDPATALKTLYVPDAVFQVPPQNTQVNAPTDFTFRFESEQGELSVFKGAKP